MVTKKRGMNERHETQKERESKNLRAKENYTERRKKKTRRNVKDKKETFYEEERSERKEKN